MSRTDVPRPWSKVATLAELAEGPRSFRLTADEAARAAGAAFLDLEAIDFLEADLETKPWLDGVEITGEVRARVTQICSVSLDPFDESVTAPVKLRVVAADSPNAPEPPTQEVALDLEADDPPDVTFDGDVDLGAYALEHLALALDPFPRKPGATFDGHDDEPPASPFAALAALKRTPSPDES